MGDVTTSADALFSCTIMTTAPGAGHATKEVIAHPVTGLPIKNQARNLGIWKGAVQHIQLAGLAGLGTLLPTLTKRQALIHGVPIGSTPDTILPLVMDEMLGKRGTPAHAIARTLTYFAYTDPHLLMFDIDPDPLDRYVIHTADELIAKLATIWPVFTDVGYLSTVSTSSAIYDKKTGAELTPPYGLHVYVLARGDVARFQDLATIKLWCADTGYCRLAHPNKRTGVAAILERCLTDLSVFSPERLDYVSGAEIDPRLPFAQRRPLPSLHTGNILDLDTLPDATPAERTEYAERLAAEKARIAPERHAVCTAHIKTTAPELPDDAIAHEVTRRIDRANHDWLAPDHVIDLARRGTLLAQDITRKHHGLACADPMEPDYGTNHAKIFWDTKDPSWVICSLAHGFKHLFFPEPQTLPPRPIGGNAPPPSEAEQLLARVIAAPADQQLQLIYEALETILAPLSSAEWALWIGQARAVLGTRLNRNDLTKARNDALAHQRRQQAQQAAQTRRQQDPRPTIIVDSEIVPVVDAIQDAILRCPTTPLYQRGRMLCHIGKGAPTLKWLQRPPDLPQILTASPAYLRECAARAASFELVDRRRRSNNQVPGLPPLWGTETLMARSSWPFPPLEGIVTSPTLRPDGSLIIDQGYDTSTGLFLDYNGTVFRAIPDKPTHRQAQKAVKRLKKVFVDFPFVAPVHLSVTLAAILSCVCRFAIMGRVPMFVVRSTTPRSGKGKLIDAISLIALGRTAPRMAQTLDEEEERKRLLSLALAGVPLLHIDNVNHPLGSGPLDGALTAPTVGDRLLGANEHREAPLTTVFFASGNNLEFQGDLVFRILPIDLDPQREDPEARDDFKHPELEKWVERVRHHLVMDALTLLRAYVTANRPTEKLPALGGYETWSALIRQALVWVGEIDPCKARIELKSQSDPLHEKRDHLLDAWEECIKGTARTLRDIKEEIALYTTKPDADPLPQWVTLRDALGAFDDRYDGRTFTARTTRAAGDALRAMQGRFIAGRRFVKDGYDAKHKGGKWKVERAQSASPMAESAESGGVIPNPSCTPEPYTLNGERGREGEKKTDKGCVYIHERRESVLTPPDSADSAMAAVGDWVETLVNGQVWPHSSAPPPYRIEGIQSGPNGGLAAVFHHAGTPWYWPLDHCEKTAPPERAEEDDLDDIPF
jgi:hypothetical protein